MSHANERPVALVTGASTGLGREFALQLAARGYDLVLVARDRPRLETLAAELGGRHGGSYEILAADLSRDAEAATVHARASRGDVALLVNNAGFATKGSFARVSLASQEAMLRVHVLVPNALAHAVLPAMLGRRSGAIVNVSSIGSYLPSPGHVNYCATKSYLRTFSETLAEEVRGCGIHVQALCPGYTHTEFHTRAGMDQSAIAGALWLDAPRVVRASLAALDKKRPVIVVPTMRYRAIAFLLRHAPPWMRRLGAERAPEDSPPAAT